MSRVIATHGAEEVMPTGLQKRGSRYYLRRRVPEDLIERLGRREITLALGTSDPKEARRRLTKEWSLLDDEWERLRRGQAGPDRLEDRPLSAISPTVIALADLDNLRLRREWAAREGRLAQFNQECEDALRLLNAMLSGELRPDDDLRVVEGRRNGIRAFLTGEGAMGLAVKRRLLVPSSEAENRLRALTSTTWETLVRKWAAERKPQEKTRKAHLAVAKEFAALMGDRPVEEVTRADVRAYKDKLIADETSTANLKTKLSRLRTLINYAYDNDLAGVRAAEGISLPKAKALARSPFDDEALRKLFGGPVHQQGLRPARGRGEAAYWLPLISLYTGARLEEIAQLRISDVLTLAYQDGAAEREAWFIRIAPVEEASRRLKTLASERYVPVHPELERLGLIRYTAALREKGEEQLFPRLTQERSGQRGRKWGEWFGQYLRETCGVVDKRIVFHSLRHTVKDCARNSGIPEGLQRQLMGHEGKDVADGYGRGFDRQSLINAICRYRVAGLPALNPSGELR